MLWPDFPVPTLEVLLLEDSRTHSNENYNSSNYLSVLCPQGWNSSLHGVCYKVYSNQLDWKSANSACIKLGANLAVFNSYAKLQEFPEKAFGGYAWIGLRRDPKDEKRWLWVGRSRPAFASWITGEPANPYIEDCGGLLLPSRKWNDLTCKYPLRYICEINGTYNSLHSCNHSQECSEGYYFLPHLFFVLFPAPWPNVVEN